MSTPKSETASQVELIEKIQRATRVINAGHPSITSHLEYRAKIAKALLNCRHDEGDKFDKLLELFNQVNDDLRNWLAL